MFNSYYHSKVKSSFIVPTILSAVNLVFSIFGRSTSPIMIIFAFSPILDWDRSSHGKRQHKEGSIIRKTDGFDEKFASSSRTGLPQHSLRRERM